MRTSIQLRRIAEIATSLGRARGDTEWNDRERERVDQAYRLLDRIPPLANGLTIDQVIDEASAMGLLDDEPTCPNCGLPHTRAEHRRLEDAGAFDPPDVEALRKLLADWFEAELFRISEVGHSGDWPGLIEDAKARHETFGIPWSNDFVPEYLREVMALSADD